MLYWNRLNSGSLFFVTTPPERFRVRAMECYVKAQKARDSQAKDNFLELMRGWRELADQIVRFEHSSLYRGYTDTE